MSESRHYGLVLALLSCLIGEGLTGCASMGSPGGGLYDETPPVLRNSEPAEGATGVRKKKITMHFDENIKLNNVMDKMTVSPPQEKSPVVQSNAKTLTIELGDSLKANTTYSIDLGDAVQDNNEGNPMTGLSLLFSTGDHIDSLQISGYLLNAADLEPITGAFVGIYRLSDDTTSVVIPTDSTGSTRSLDSLFVRHPFERAGKTDALGAFKILGCAPGSYLMYALVDGNTNYRYDLSTEDIAFVDTLVVPGLDSIAINLLAFNEGRLTRYLEDCSRPDSLHINIRFATHMDSLVQIAILQKDGSWIEGDSLLVAELNPTLDTLSYWIRDSLLYRQDTLTLQLRYLYTDTLGIDVPRLDTLELVKPVVRTVAKEEPKAENKKSGKKGRKHKETQPTDSVTAPKTTFMELKQIAGQSLEIGAKPRFETSAPIDSISLAGMHLQYKRDTSWVDMDFKWVADSLHPRRYTLLAEPHYTPQYSYQLVVDSAAMHNIYGHPIARTVLPFREKSNEDYAHLLINVEGIDETAYVELLDAKDKPVQRTQVIKGQAKFVHVSPGTYFARLFIDSNGNGRWDTGSLSERRHPETVYYMPTQLDLRANWTIQQNWNPRETPLLQQKPKEVKINKPKEEKEKKSKNEEYLRKLGKL